MTKRKQSTIETAAPVAILAGQFFVITADAVTVHVLTADAERTYWDAATMAERSTRPDIYGPQVLRDMFGIKNALGALPASSAAALLYYAEHYEGPHKDAVRGLAACIVTGQTYGPDENRGPDGGGTPARLPEAPKGPKGGSGLAVAETAQPVAAVA